MDRAWQILVELYWKPFIPKGLGIVGGHVEENDIHYDFSLFRHVNKDCDGLMGTGVVNAKYVKVWWNVKSGEKPKSLMKQEVSP